MIIGYARTSTTDQQAGLDAQVRDLTAAGAERVSRNRFRASPSARNSTRRWASSGLATRGSAPSRIGWRGRPAISWTSQRSCSGGRNTENPVHGRYGQRSHTIGKLMLTMLGAVATFEREIMLERQRELSLRQPARAHTRGVSLPRAPRRATCTGWRTAAPLARRSPARPASASPACIASCQRGRQQHDLAHRARADRAWRADLAPCHLRGRLTGAPGSSIVAEITRPAARHVECYHTVLKSAWDPTGGYGVPALRAHWGHP